MLLSLFFPIASLSKGTCCLFPMERLPPPGRPQWLSPPAMSSLGAWSSTRPLPRFLALSNDKDTTQTAGSQAPRAPQPWAGQAEQSLGRPGTSLDRCAGAAGVRSAGEPRRNRPPLPAIPAPQKAAPRTGNCGRTHALGGRQQPTSQMPQLPVCHVSLDLTAVCAACDLYGNALPALSQ